MQDLVLPEGYGWEMTDGLYKRQAFKTINNKVVLEKKITIIIKAPWPRIGLKSLETRRKLSPP